jgi:hypothetical protein
MAARRHDRSALLFQLRFGVERLLAQDEEISFGHAVSVPAAPD